MSDLTFNKIAGAVLATGLAVTGLIQLSGGVFSQDKVAKPGFKVDVVADTGGGAAAADVPPDWGTVLPTADVAAGQTVFAKCQSCHALGANGTGPNLMGVVGRHPGTEAGFSYSDGMKAFGAKQPVWDYDHLYMFLKGPQAYVSGTKMSFVGLKQPQDRINLIAYLRGQGADLIKEIEEDLRQVLASHHVPVAEVTGREKAPYSIWLKMQKKNVAFEQLSDVMAFRILIPDGEKAMCYAALGAVHDAYRVVPGRFKDYISTPKTNGYQSLHTGVTVPERRHAKIEVQIRTTEMHDVAENGVAAHWIYKQGNEATPNGKWVRALLDILEDAEGQPHQHSSALPAH